MPADRIESMSTPSAMLSKLLRMFPGFEAEWKSDQNVFLEASGDFTYHGLFFEFSRYFQDHFQEMNSQKIQELCDYIEQFVRDDVDDSIDNAICTCFLEHVGRNPDWDNSRYKTLSQKEELFRETTMYAELPKYLGPKSIKFYLNWHKA